MMTIPKGYKDSKVGIIPADWDIVRIGDLFTFKNGLNKGKEFFGKGTPIVNYVDVYKKQFLTKDNFNGLVSVTVNELKNYQVKKGDVFFTRTSETIEEIGYSTVVIEDVEDTVFSGFVLRGRPKNKLLNDNYKKYCFSTFEARKEIIRKSSMTTRALTNGTLLSGVLLAKPPKEEQSKIAEILTTWDNAIKQQESLIKEKKQLKIGLMQKLLSGEKRFAEFDDEWEEVKLGTIFKERSERYKDLNSSEIQRYTELLSVGINSGVTKRSANGAKDNSSEDKGNYKILKKNDITYNTMRMWQGASGVSSYDGIVSPAYTIVTLEKDYNINFFGYLFKLHRVVFDFYRYSQGLTSDTWNIKFPHFSKVLVKIPTTKLEQDKIVFVLESADKEIGLLKQELEELKKQKKGLMQNLLTGKVRVKV